MKPKDGDFTAPDLNLAARLAGWLLNSQTFSPDVTLHSAVCEIESSLHVEELGCAVYKDTVSFSGARVKKETLPRFLNLLSPILHSWDLFVHQIGIPSDKIFEIKVTNANSGPNWLYICFTQAMEWWVANHSSPTYEMIIAVLDPEMGQTTPVMNRTLASQVKEFMAKEWSEFLFEVCSYLNKYNCL